MNFPPLQVCVVAGNRFCGVWRSVQHKNTLAFLLTEFIWPLLWPEAPISIWWLYNNMYVGLPWYLNNRFHFKNAKHTQACQIHWWTLAHWNLTLQGQTWTSSLYRFLDKTAGIDLVSGHKCCVWVSFLSLLLKLSPACCKAPPLPLAARASVRQQRRPHQICHGA